MTTTHADLAKLQSDVDAIKLKLDEIAAVKIEILDLKAAISTSQREPADINNWKLKERVEALERRVVDLERGHGNLESLIRANHMAQLHIASETARHLMPKNVYEKVIRDVRQMVEDHE